MTKTFVIQRLLVTVFVFPSKNIGWVEVKTPSRKLFYRADSPDSTEAFMICSPKGSKTITAMELDKALKKAIDMPLSRLLAYLRARV